jgi:hypothetical protein
MQQDSNMSTQDDRINCNDEEKKTRPTINCNDEEKKNSTYKVRQSSNIISRKIPHTVQENC